MVLEFIYVTFFLDKKSNQKNQVDSYALSEGNELWIDSSSESFTNTVFAPF